MNLYESFIELWAADATLNGICDSTLIFPGKSQDPTTIPPYVTINTFDDGQDIVTSKSIVETEVIRIEIFTDSQAKCRQALLRLRQLLREKKVLTLDDGTLLNIRRMAGLKQPMTKGVQSAYDDYAITKQTSR